MLTPGDADNLDAMSTLIEYVIDSFEKLDIIVHLFRVRPQPVDSNALGRALSMAPEAVVGALTRLGQAGVIRSSEGHDDGGWWFDPAGVWATTVEVMVELYDIDRDELLRFMKHVAFESLRPPVDRRSVAFAYIRRSRLGKPPIPS